MLDVLCQEAIDTNNHGIREVLIRTLKGNKEEANGRFSNVVMHSKNSIHRRWALINLSLMECRNAKEAVMASLQDSHHAVRIAAAFNSGLYCDADVVNALELFFERDRFLFVRDRVCDSIKAFMPLIQKLRKIYIEFCRHGDILTGKTNKSLDSVVPRL